MITLRKEFIKNLTDVKEHVPIQGLDWIPFKTIENRGTRLGALIYPIFNSQEDKEELHGLKRPPKNVTQYSL